DPDRHLQDLDDGRQGLSPGTDGGCARQAGLCPHTPGPEDAAPEDLALMGMEPLLAADGIAVRLGGAPVLRDVTLEVFAGEVLGVFGPSGAGKSTLFRALAGEQPLRSGRVFLEGHDVTSLPLWARARRGLGYLPQTPSVLWDLTVAENLAVFRSVAVVLGP